MENRSLVTIAEHSREKILYMLEMAKEFEADGDIVAHVFQSEQGDYGKQSLGGYMVYYSAVFQSSNLQFLFLFA